MTNPPANWYPDPSNESQLRYWDGEKWTEYTHGQPTASQSNTPSNNTTNYQNPPAAAAVSDSNTYPLSGEQALSLARGPGLLTLIGLLAIAAIVEATTGFLTDKSAETHGIAFIIAFLLLFLPTALWFIAPGRTLASACVKRGIDYPSRWQLVFAFLLTGIGAGIIIGLLLVVLIFIATLTISDSTVLLVLGVVMVLLIYCGVFVLMLSRILPVAFNWKKSTAKTFVIILAVLFVLVSVIPSAVALISTTADKSRMWSGQNDTASGCKSAAQDRAGDLGAIFPDLFKSNNDSADGSKCIDNRSLQQQQPQPNQQLPPMP